MWSWVSFNMLEKTVSHKKRLKSTTCERQEKLELWVILKLNIYSQIFVEINFRVYRIDSLSHFHGDQLTEVILSKSWTGQLTSHLLDILGCRPKKINCFEMRHGLPWLGNGIYQFHQKHFFLKKVWLRIDNANYTNLQVTKKLTP